MPEMPKQASHGFLYYEALPKGWRVAVANDFPANADQKPYLLKSFHSGRYYCMRVMEPLQVQTMFSDWLNDNRVFVLK